MIKILIYPFLYLVYLLPRRVQMFFGTCLGWLWYYVIPIRKKLTISHVKKAFPDMSDKEAKNITKQSFINFGQAVYDYFSFPFFTDKDLNKISVVEGLEFVDAAYAQGNGVFFLGSHLGAGELGIYRVARLGYKIVLLGKRIGNKFLDSFLFALRERSGVEHLPPWKSTTQILEALTENKGIIFVMDQCTRGRSGVKTKFFGHPVGSAKGLATLKLLRPEVPIIPCNGYRKGSGIVIVFEKPLEIDHSHLGSKEEKVQFLTQKYSDFVEKIIKVHPGQWMWFHKRWKKMG